MRSADTARALKRAAQLADFLEAVTLGKRKATEAEVAQAWAELDELLPDVQPQSVRG